MLSSKLKSWVESHLTRKKTAGSKKSSHGTMNGTGGSGSYGGNKESPADRITHPAASLVNLVPAVPLCSSSGRSNAGLVIRLQNDFAAAAAVSPCNRSHHPSWSQSPVMLAWNTKIQPGHHHHRHHQRIVATPSPLPDPPISPPPSASSTLQNGEPSPTGSDWTSKSLAGESGIGGGSLASSKATDTSMCTVDFDSGCGRINAPSLSSPESAYSTGCSDGISPSQDGFDPVHHPQTLLLDSVWRRSLMTDQIDGSGTNSSSTQSPRSRPAIRTNPWLPIRTSMTSSDRTSWMTDTTTEAILASGPTAVKETDIVSSSGEEFELNDPVAAEAARAAANAELDQLCNSLELLMDGDQLKVISQSQPPRIPSMKATPSRMMAEPESTMDRRWEVDDQYTQLIRQTEEILLQLEKDELLLASRKQQPEEEHLVVNGVLHPPVVKGLAIRPQQQCQRRRLRKTAAMRRCSSRNSRVDIFSSSSSEESSDSGDYHSTANYSSHNRRMLPATPSDWNANRRAPKSVNRNTGSRSITPRFATRQNGRVLPHLSSSFSPSAQQQQPNVPPPPPAPAPPSRDRWILNSQLTSCSPDDWTTEHDRPPSPAPMDPHCHWSSTTSPLPAMQLRPQELRNRSPSISSCSNGNRPTRRSQYRRHSGGGASCPTSPAIRCGIDDNWDSMSARGSVGYSGRRWRKSLTREQQRLESQIAFLRRQLKDVTDDYYYENRDDTPSSSSSTDGSFLK